VKKRVAVGSRNKFSFKDKMIFHGVFTQKAMILAKN